MKLQRIPWTLSLLFFSIFNSPHAMALYHFECGIYQAPGYLRVQEASKKDPSIGQFTLFRDSMSETKIKVQVSPKVLQRLVSQKGSEAPGLYTLRIQQKGTQPESGSVHGVKALKSPADLKRADRIRLLQKEDCAD